MPIVTISGNIGSGKSTCISNLAREYEGCGNTKLFFEPIEHWGEWLNLFYENPRKNALGFQIKVLLGFLYLKEDACCRKNDLIITERSPDDSLYVFAQNLFNNKLLSKTEFDLVRDFSNETSWKPDVYIYIKTRPEVAYARMQVRSRECEKSVDLDYLKQLHDLYERHVSLLSSKTEITVYMVDGNKSVLEVNREVQKIIANIRSSI
jgi:deoxyadenosine/deoxycytidine kinase